MFRRLAIVAGGSLALFHAWLLGSQVWHGQLLEPGLAFRWAVAIGLALTLAAHHRAGGSLLWGRKAVSIWLLAALLHGPAVAEGLQHNAPALPEAVTTVVQVAASVALGLGLLLAASGLRRHRIVLVRRAFLSRPSPVWTRSTITRGRAFAPRPPPLPLRFAHS